MLDLVLKHFITEREAIRVRKASGQPAPWTEDPILAKYRFCNIRRRDDRVSQWLLRSYYPLVDPHKDVWLAAAVARIINWPPTLDAFFEAGLTFDDADNFDGAGFKNVIRLLKQEKVKVYTGAYMVYPGSRDGGTSLTNKEDFIADTVLAGLIANKDKIRYAVSEKSVKGVVDALSSSYGLQTFMAGQIAADLTYLPHQLSEAYDLYNYAPMGPGSIRGLNRLHGYKLSNVWTEREFRDALMQINWDVGKEMGIDDLTLHDSQNVMCEYDKYVRVLNSEGRPRSVYKPETAFELDLTHKLG